MNTLTKNTKVSDVFKIKDVSIRTTEKGSEFVSGALCDKTGDIAFVKWDITSSERPNWTNGATLLINGAVGEFNKRLQVKISDAMPAGAFAIDASDFEEVSPIPFDKLQKDFKEITDKIGDGGLSALVKAVFSDKAVWERFSTWPAAVQYHHAYKYGLFEHTVSAARLGLEIAKSTGRVDKDYLLAGCCFHDIGKIYELTGSSPYDYTDEGRLIGHIVLGANLVRDKAAEVKGFPEDKLTRVLHMILAHHGERQFGSPIVPSTAEAVALHYIDNIDAKLQAADYVIGRDQTPGTWTDYVKMFETRLFKGTEGTGE